MSGFGYNVLGFGANSSGGGEVLPSDDQFNRVSFLSHFEGSNNGVNNAFDDGSASNHTVTAAGNVTQGSFGPFARPDGEWGVSFDGSGDYLQAANSADWDLGTGNFTWECYANINDITRTQWFFSVFTTNSGQNAWGLRLESNGTLNAYFSGDGGESVTAIGVAAASSGLTENAWHHIAVVKNGTGSSNIQIYVDGVSKVTGTFGAIHDTNLPFRVGRQGNDTYAQYFLGQISNIRIIKGTALYTGNFTAPTSKLTAITNTKLLTCQSNRFVDNSASGHTITPSGNAAVTSFGPFLTSKVYNPAVNGASAYFDGTADALSIAASPISASGNFTLEGWVYSNSASEQAIVGQYQGRSTGRMIITTGSGLLIFFQNGVTGGNNGSSVALGQWAHFVLQRTGSNIAFYVNGTRILNNSAGNIAQDYLVIGAEDVNSGNYPNTFDGYISNIRVTSSAVYSEGTSITVPTAPYSTVTNTNFLLNMADAQAIDSTAQNNLTLYGTAKTSTAQKKFGTASLLLDGNSDYASFPENGGNDIDNAGNWTVEFFWRFNNKTSPQYQMIMTKYNLQIYTDNGELRLAIGNGSGYFINNTGGTVLDNDTWYHIAVVKNGTSYNEYLNGTNEANLDGTSSSIIDSGGRPWYIGTLQTAEGTYPANGYMDEVRISKFARYTSNFTAPTEPFADKGQ